MLVESVMTRSVLTTQPTCSVHAAAQVMHEHRFRHLPVVERGRLVGIVSDRDLVRREGLTVGDVMRSSIVSVSPDTPVEVAARLMLDNKVGALPVLGGGTDDLVGIVTQSDIFDVFVRLLGADRPTTRLEVQLTDLSRQLAEITSLAHQHGVRIASLVTLPEAAQRGRGHTVVLRIETIMATRFVAELRHAGIDVAGPGERLTQATAHG